MQIRSLQKQDIPQVKALLTEGAPFVTSYAAYLYWMLGAYFPSTCLVAEEDGRICGYIGALPSAEKEMVFIWQIAVAKAIRGRGVAKSLLCSVLQRARGMGFSKIEIAISEENTACIRLLQSAAAEIGYHIEEAGTYADEQFQETIYHLF